MNSVELVKSICKQKKIPISRLEGDLGFSNGYISQLRKGSFPADRLAKIAEYLEMPMSYFLGEEIEKPTPMTESELDDSIVAKMLQLTPAEIEKVSAFVEGLIAARQA